MGTEGRVATKGNDGQKVVSIDEDGDVLELAEFKGFQMIDLLGDISTTLKKIEYHLSIASDTELKDQDVS